MEEVIKYKAVDGKIFDSKEECKRYDVIAKQVGNFFIKLPLKGHVSGDGYILHDLNMKIKLNKLTIKLANDWFGEGTFTSMSYTLGRYIDDSNMSCLKRLTYLYMCTDRDGKQWNQPYFVNNPEKGVDKRLN